MAVEFPRNVTAILRPRGGMSHCAVSMLSGIHSAKNALILCTFSVCSSTSFIETLPRKTAAWTWRGIHPFSHHLAQRSAFARAPAMAMAEDVQTPYAVVATRRSSAAASGLVVGVGTVYNNGGRAEVEVAGRKVAIVPVCRRSRLPLVSPLLAPPWVVQS